MSSAFSHFDYSYTLTKYIVTEGYYNTSGVWVPQTDSSTTFYGHLSAITEKELQFLPEAVRETGAMRLSVDAADVSLKDGDRIKITEYDGATSNWHVVKEAGSTSIMASLGIHRRQFYISHTKN